MKKLFYRIFNRWTKWEIYKSDLSYEKTLVNNVTGWETKPTKVLVDIYEKTNKYTGLKKYKKVEKQ